MNKLGLGLEKDLLPEGDCLLIADEAPAGFKVFDPTKHCINPFNQTYRRARDLASIFYGMEGKDTLTVRNGKRALTRAFMEAKNLDIKFGTSDADKEAEALLDDLKLSPVLSKIFNTTNTVLKGRICARVNRAELGDFDTKIIGSVLALLYPGTVVIEDFGFYARDFHKTLLRENRLRIGVNSLEELDSEMKQMVLLIEEKEGRKCTFEDAKILANYSGLISGTNAHGAFVERAMN